jgi:peptidoglycan hydrolase-like amidase
MRNGQAVTTFILFLLTIFAGSVGCGGQTGGDARSGAGPVFRDEPVVRVLILDTTESITLTPHDDWKLTSEGQSETWGPGDGPLDLSAVSGNIRSSLLENRGSIQPEMLTFVGVHDSATLTILGVPYGVGWWWEGKEDREYEGVIRIHAVDGERLQVVVELPLERYLKGVVPYEIGGDSPPEALKAQAVAARSEAVRALTTGLYSGPGYDLTSDVESQVFSGNIRRTEASDRAVDETASLILSGNGQPVNAYYASNCGGHSELIRNVWPDRPDPLTYHSALTDSDERVLLDLSSEERLRDWISSEPDVFCNPDLEPGLPEWSRANFRWQRTFTDDEISSMVSAGIDRNRMSAGTDIEHSGSSQGDTDDQRAQGAQGDTYNQTTPGTTSDKLSTVIPSAATAQPWRSRGTREIVSRENRKSWINRALRHPWPRCNGTIWFDFAPLRSAALTMTASPPKQCCPLAKLHTRDGNTESGRCHPDCGRLTGIVPLKRGPSGRMYEARFDFERDSFEVTGELAIRQLFMPPLRSSAFVADRDSDTWNLKGAGWGHGVGMCQSGAVAQALQGRDFITILGHYYPDTQIIKSY